MRPSVKSSSAKRKTARRYGTEEYREYARQYRVKNREKLTAQARRWRRRNPDKVAAKQRRVMAKRRLSPEGYTKLLLRSARQRAKPRSAPGGRAASVSITAADILAVWPKNNRCPVLGTPFRFGPVDYSHRANIPSLDRIDSRRGYEPGNIAVISWRANTIKNDASLEEVQKLAAWLKKFY